MGSCSGHGVRFYTDDNSFFTDRVSAFLAEGLEAGDSCIVVATDAHCRLLDESLEELGLGEVLSSPRYITHNVRDALAGFMVDGVPDSNSFKTLYFGLLAQASRQGSGRVRVFGEMVAELVADGNARAAIRLEQLWNELGQTFEFSLLCAYPIEPFVSGGQGLNNLMQICAEHSHVELPQHLWRVGGMQPAA